MIKSAPLSLALGALVVSAAIAAGCVQPVTVPQAAMSLVPADVVKKLAESPTQQWSSGLLNNAEVQRAKVAFQDSVRQRHIQTVTPNWDAASAGFAGTGAAGRISSAPAYHFYTKEAFWLTESGWLLKYNTRTGATAAFLVNNSETFPNTAITLSNNGKRAYFVSAQGTFYAVDTATGANITGTPIAMGGTNANMAFGSPPFVDPITSREDGQLETVYAVTASGVLHRFFVNALNTSAVPTVELAQTYALPVVNNGSFTEICRSAPVVLGGKVTITTWRRSTSAPYNQALDEGALMYYNTGATTNSTAVTAGSLIRRTALPYAVWAPPSLDFGGPSLDPTLAFFPAGNTLMMVDMTNGNYAQSVPLVVDAKTPVSGMLDGYPYSASGISTITKFPKTNSDVVIYGDNTTNTTNLYAAKQVSNGDTTQMYGYVKFELLNSDLTVGGATKVVTDARLVMRCNASSNALGIYAATPLRVFRVSNSLGLLSWGNDWTNGNMTYIQRPGHMGGQMFDQTAANLNANASWELSPNTNNVYLSGSDYSWPARGKVASPNQDYSFGLVHTSLFENGTLLGLLSQPAPKFVGGTANAASPRLVLTLSNAGLANPTLSAPVALDSWNQQAFVVNSNALFKVNYGAAGGSFAERAANLGDDSKTFFALTRLGQDTDSPGNAGPLQTAPSVRFVENTTAPLFDGTYVYVQDQHPTFLRTAISRFTPGAVGAAPALSSSLLLSNTASDAKLNTPYMVFDYESQRLMAASYDSASAKGHAWVVNRF